MVFLPGPDKMAEGIWIFWHKTVSFLVAIKIEYICMKSNILAKKRKILQMFGYCG